MKILASSIHTERNGKSLLVGFSGVNFAHVYVLDYFASKTRTFAFRGSLITHHFQSLQI